MGCKRACDADDFREFPYKHSQRFPYGNNLASFAEIVSRNDAPVKSTIHGEKKDFFYGLQWYDTFEKETTREFPHIGDKEFATNVCFSGSSSEDDSGSGVTSLSSLSSDCPKGDLVEKASIPFNDAYYSLDCSPRRGVPIGPNHQATIPICCRPHSKMPAQLTTLNCDSACPATGAKIAVDNDSEKFLGTCLIPMPDSSSLSYDRAGRGGCRTKCSCLDSCSVRCVRQHIMEARKNLRDTLGHELLVDLGIRDMGEEVAFQWSEEEEEVFHEVVYSNPASLYRNFWKNLSATFPSQTKMEIISYYFNVFILRRRASQNRSRLLDIDSDDDEYHHGISRGPYNAEAGEEEHSDSAVESPDVPGNHVGNQEYYFEEDGDDDDEDDNHIKCNYCNCENFNGITREEDGRIEQILKTRKGNLFDQSKPEPHVPNVDESQAPTAVTNDDSGIYFECPTTLVDACDALDSGTALQQAVVDLKSNHGLQSPERLVGSGDAVDHGYLSYPCDSKDWYLGYTTGPAANIDLLPTSNIIEEIFGQDKDNLDN